MSEAKPLQKRHWLRAILTVIAGIALALVLLFFTRAFWIERIIERYASRATNKQVDVNGVYLGRDFEIAEAVVTDPAHPEKPLAHVTGLRVSFSFGPGFHLNIEGVSAKHIDIDWQQNPPGNAENDATPSSRGAGFFRGAKGKGGKGSAAGLMPALVAIDELNFDATTPEGTCHLGPIKIVAHPRPAEAMSIDVTGTPTVHAEGPRLPNPIDGTGDIKIHVTRDAKGVSSEIAVHLPGTAALEATISGGRGKSGFSAGLSIAKGVLEGPVWPALLSAAAGIPIDFDRIEAAPDGAIQLQAGSGDPMFRGLKLALSTPRLRVGPADAPLFNAPITVAVSPDSKDENAAVARIQLGKDVALRAALASMIPPKIETTFEKVSVAALCAIAPALKPLHDAFPVLSDISGKALFTAYLPATGVGAEVSLKAGIKGVEKPLGVDAKYIPVPPGTYSAKLALSDDTHLDIPPYTPATKDQRLKYSAKGDLTELGPLLGLEGWGGTLEAAGDLAPGMPGMPGHGDAKFLNLVSDHFHLPYDVPMTVSAEHTFDTLSRALVVKDLKAALAADATATIAKLRFSPTLAAEDLKLHALAPFLVAQGFLDSGDATLDLAAAKATFENGSINTSADFKIDAKNVVLPQKLAAAVNLSGSGKLGWSGGLEASGNLSAEKVICAGAELQTATCTLRADGPTLVLDDLKGTLFGGAAAGNLRVDLFDKAMPMKLDARIEGGDLAVFTQQVKPSSVNLTGVVAGNILVGLAGQEFTALDIDLDAPKGITVNRDLVQQALMAQQLSGFTGAKTAAKVLDSVIGGEEQRPFDSAALKLGLGDGRIIGTAILKSKALNLDFDIKADPGAVWEAIQSRGEIHIAGFN